MLLIATGHYNGMSNGDFNQRIFRGIQQFQQSIGSNPNGILSAEDAAALKSTGYRFLGAAGLKEVFHPTASAKLYVPLGLLDPALRTSRGLSYEGTNAAVDFSAIPSVEVSFPDLYARLAATSAQRQVSYKVLRTDFFVVAGRNGSRNFYSRFHPLDHLSVGFTFAWDDSVLGGNGDRIAATMSNMFFTGINPAQTTSTTPGDSASPSSPPPQKEVAKKKGASAGTAFLVNGSGHLITNNHVVEECTTFSVVGGASGIVVARDAVNDLALLKAEPPKGAEPLPLAGRMTKLGEDVVAMGFPFQGVLGGLNVTGGNVSALSGLQNDSSRVQFTAAIQPGNSGGPLLDRTGAVVGVVTGKLNELATFKVAGSIPQNVNFAVRKEIVSAFLASQAISPATATASGDKSISDVAEAARSAVFAITCGG